MSASKTAEKSQKKESGQRTPEIILADIRKNFSSGLAVTPEDQRFLLAVYDTAIAEATSLGVRLGKVEKQLDEALGVNLDLQAKNEEFRRVYEIENRNSTLVIHASDADDFTRIDPSKSARAAVESIESETV